ncbi:DUF262 domain-containing protein [Methanococcus voltae]|uniref:DUF262 domain-containing protein n=1 Tax=Methanococcus voltae (strain ATCC BAA-1334 / A3) TaxID=456320 RepID=D7DQR0_METV3|nr:DUF262 domain-containing protein [Methanococcus voltae]MCS3900847.1 uncharacterized protein with ParB-like and HNH nuclease domain [Methanococcus voltae]
MNADAKKLLRYMEGADKQFIIPVYQRNYDWTIENCGQLFNDIVSIAKEEYNNHFLGALVSIYHDDGIGQDYLIIDGQQRITTISLLLLAIYNLVKNQNLETKFNPEQILESFLINKYTKSKRMRLKPINEDNSAFIKLFNNEESEFIQESNITSNYLFFLERIKKEEVTLDELYTAIGKLEIVDIKLQSSDDPQLIFESLNSTGLSLQQSDLVRNFILMNEEPKVQEKYYEDYWFKIEKNTGNHISDFIRDYITFKERNAPKTNRTYIAFKKFVSLKEQDYSKENLLKELLKFSKYYKTIINEDGPNDEISKELSNINKLEIKVCYPFLLEVFDDHANSIINDDELLEILKIIESYSFRRSICNESTASLNKLFMTLGRDLKKNEDYTQNYLDILKYVLSNKKSKQRFPNDEEFSEKLPTVDIYAMKKKLIYLLHTLENYDNKEYVDVEKLLAKNMLTIEHIMPRTLTKRWRIALGRDYGEIHEKYVDTIGNLTLTAYNSEMSNKSFKDKKTMKNGFNSSKLSINAGISTFKNWNSQSIEERALNITKKALNIWSYPTTNYIPKIELKNMYYLSDDYEFTGNKIRSFTYNGKKYEVDSWIEFYQRIIEIIYLEKTSEFESLLYDTDNNGKKRNGKILSKQSNTYTRHFKLSDNIYVNKNLSVDSIISNIKQLFRKCNINLNSITLYLRDLNDN